MRSLFSHLLILAFLLNALPARAEGEDDTANASTSPSIQEKPTVADVLSSEPIPEGRHFKWNEQGRTIWELFGVEPGELEDDVQDRKRVLLAKGGTPEVILNEAWPLMKQPGFAKFYAGFVLAFGGTDSFKPGQGAVHVLLFNSYYKTYKFMPISLLWDTAEKLDKLAEMVDSTEEFKEVYEKRDTDQIRAYAQKLRENTATVIRESGRRRWFRGETWALALKSKYLFGGAVVCALMLAAYHKGASDYAPKPSEVMQQRHDPLPVATDVRNPAQTQQMQKAADEAAIERGEEARKLFDME